MEKKILISYDREADVVYLRFDRPIKAEAEEIGDGIFARYRPQTKELAGLTIVNFSKKFGMRPKEVSVPIYK
jgi:uncharacterized protein YuzE